MGEWCAVSERITYLDNARAFSMIWIVGVYHMLGYMNISNEAHMESFFNVLTVSALSTFSFVSAYFLGIKTFENKIDLMDFYKKWFLRIYPLFLVSCVTLYIFGLLTGGGYFHNGNTLFLTLKGISSIIGPAPKTVWYISMMIMLYSKTP